MKNLRKVTTAILATLLISSAASAQVINPSDADDFAVKYTGTEDNYLCFNVTVASALLRNAFLKVEDTNEGEIYSENFNKTATTVKFKIEKKQGQILTFKLTSGKNVFARTFTSDIKLVEQVTVSENSIASL